jgi:hypothetical protein
MVTKIYLCARLPANALSEQIAGQMITQLNCVPENLPVIERLVQLALSYVQFAISNKENFQLMNTLPSRRKSLDEPIPKGSPYTIFLQAVQAAIESGEIRAQPDYTAEEITYSLWALIHGMAMLRLTHLQTFQADFEKTDRQAIETLLKGLR